MLKSLYKRGKTGSKLPYVIDNQSHKLADILNQVMQEHPGMSLDIATAYFSVSGYRALREQMKSLAKFSPAVGLSTCRKRNLGLRPNASALPGPFKVIWNGNHILKNPAPC